MKEFNCPDCNLQIDTCNGCHRMQERITNILEENERQVWNLGFDYKCCRTCHNNPKNGGSGICNCVLPYMSRTGNPITYTTNTVSITKKGDDNTYA